jgi:hypothetical protein
MDLIGCVKVVGWAISATYSGTYHVYQRIMGSKPKNVKWQMQNVKVSVFNFYILRFYILHFAVESNGTKH